jgi:outer membrane protein|tara:strand:+ start:972 stop:1637 length:666 start_codon:yes stop_codon:yes gene_type:complete
MKNKSLNTTLISALVYPMLMVPTLVSANETGDVIVRGGFSLVDPDSGKSPVFLNGSDSGLTVTVDDNPQLSGTIAYFFDANWAVEFIVATPFTHDIALEGQKVAKASHLPPIVSALYYFDTASSFQPYVGIGINYTYFYDEKFNAAGEASGFSNLSLGTSVGGAVQAGVDYYLNEAWLVNVSLRYADISTDLTFDVANGAKGSSTIDVDPMVYSLMVGYKF